MKSNYLLEIKLINRLAYKITTLFVFNKRKRRKIKKAFLDALGEDKVNRITTKYKDYWIFSLFFPWGDLGIACSLIKLFKEIYGGKVLVLVNNKNRANVVKLFPSIDKVKIVDSTVYDYIYRNPNFEIKKGEYFEINHWKFINAPRYKSEHFLELYARMLNLSNWTNIEQPVFTDEIKQSVHEKIKKMNLDIEKTIFISKDSNSFNCNLLTDEFWLNKANKFKEQGYEVIFNSSKKHIKEYKTIFLPMAEQLYFCSLCKKVIAIRSGFNDLLGIMGLKNLEIYYPESMLFSTIEPIEQMIEFKRSFKDEQDKTFNENMFRITSMKMFDIQDIEEIIITKEQL